MNFSNIFFAINYFNLSTSSFFYFLIHFISALYNKLYFDIFLAAGMLCKSFELQYSTQEIYLPVARGASNNIYMFYF